MGFTARRGAVSEKTYAVSGKTLDEIIKDMAKKGPNDPNESKKYSGSCLGKLEIDIKPKDIEYEVKSNGGKFAAIARLKSGYVTSTAAITTPKLASDKGLSDAARKEWQRFMVFVGVHERGHADSYYVLAVKVMQDMSAMSGAGTGNSENGAKTAATKALYEQITKKYGGSALSDLVKADAKAYDSKTKHGESQGAVLDASIA
jgi:predicted secreted Zn-dependent protease